MANKVIEAQGVTRYFGETRAVDDVDLMVEQGELFGLIGHNGAGKTTLFKVMLGLLPPTSGEIRIDGEPVHGEGFREVRRRIGYLPESVMLYDNLSALETLLFFARLKHADPSSCMPLLERVGLGPFARQRVRSYSKGMRQRLILAQALLGAPRLLFLDEPTNGLDPHGIQELYRILRELRDQGVTIVLTSHILAEIEQRVDRLAVMSMGRIQALGTVQALREALNLPLVVEIRLNPGAEESLRRVLSDQPILSVEITGANAHLQCQRRDKLAILAALTALRPQVLDIQLKEPSLEEIFMGYREAQ